LLRRRPRSGRKARERAAIEREISALDQQITEYESRRTLVITAPADGVVTAILAGRGQSVAAGAPLLSILPEGAVLQAQLLVPGRAVGFLAAGQPVALRYQAFPFQRFGNSHGVVKEIARSLIAPGDRSCRWHSTSRRIASRSRSSGRRFALTERTFRCRTECC
jgi:membrane fusion protein